MIAMRQIFQRQPIQNLDLVNTQNSKSIGYTHDTPVKVLYKKKSRLYDDSTQNIRLENKLAGANLLASLFT